MSKPNILLTRVDNRLVHGQVGITWTRTLGANLIIVADDEIAEDKLQQQLMAITAESSGAGIRFFTLKKTMDIIHKAAEHQKIFLICRNPENVLKLVQGGVPIEEVNVGNMHFTKGKRQISKKVYVDREDLESFKALEVNGVNVYIQDVPGDIKEKVNY